MVGGGIHNALLCQWTANAIGKPVWAGPAKAARIGNWLVQWIAQGEFADIWEARQRHSRIVPGDGRTSRRIESRQWERRMDGSRGCDGTAQVYNRTFMKEKREDVCWLRNAMRK